MRQYFDPTGTPHLLASSMAGPRRELPYASFRQRRRVVKKGADIAFWPVTLAPGATPVLSGLRGDDEIPSWGKIDEVGGSLAFKAPLSVIGGTVVGALLFTAIAAKPWLGAIAGAGFGYLASALGRENRALKRADAAPAAVAATGK